MPAINKNKSLIMKKKLSQCNKICKVPRSKSNENVQGLYGIKQGLYEIKFYYKTLKKI